VDRLVNLSFRDKKQTGHFDLESLEMQIRSLMHQIGSNILERLLNSDGGDDKGSATPCERGHVYDFIGYREKKFHTVLGPVAVKRAYYYDKERRQWAHKRRKELDQGKVEKVINPISELPASSKEEKELFEKEANYFDKNKNRMRYNEFRKEGLFVGSGVLEARCRTVIGQRLKQSGMHWTVKGANNILALRCCFFSNRWEDFWEYRAWV